MIEINNSFDRLPKSGRKKLNEAQEKEIVVHFSLLPFSTDATAATVSVCMASVGKTLKEKGLR